MSEIIKVNPNKDGRAIATIYGKDFDLTEMADENGKGTFKAFGNEYQFEIKKWRKASATKLPEKLAKGGVVKGSTAVDSEENEE